MAQIAFKILLERSNFFLDFILCYISVFVHSFLQNTQIESINFEVRKYDTIFYLTGMLLFARIIITITVQRDKQIIENNIKREELRKLKLENDKQELENKTTRSQLPPASQNSNCPST